MSSLALDCRTLVRWAGIAVVRRSRMFADILTAPLPRLMCDASLVFSSCKVGPVFVQYYKPVISGQQ